MAASKKGADGGHESCWFIGGAAEMTIIKGVEISGRD